MFFKVNLYIILLLSVCIILSYGQNYTNAFVNLCDNNGIHSCICDESTNLKNLHLLRVMCSFQNINKIGNDMIIPNNTESLDFSVNNITELMYAKIFDSLNILILHLNRNKINKIQSGTFVDLSNLSELDLSKNELQHLDGGVFHGIYKLKRLYLYSNKFTTLQQNVFQGLPVLEVLSLSDNNIGGYLTSAPDVFTLQGISINPKLQSLYLNNVNLSVLPPNFFDNAYNIRELHVRKNPIDAFPKLPFTLEILDISGIGISSLTQNNFLYLPAVKYLYMNDLENLTTIEKYSFHPMKGLTHLQLQNCKRLQNFDNDVFGINTNDTDFEFSVVDINFMGSGLRSLDEKLMPLFSKLSNLDLRSNPWVCDCKITWLLDLQLGDQMKELVRCDRPPNLKGKTIFSLKPKDFECKTWSIVVDSLTRIVLVLLCIALGGLAVWLIMVWSPHGTSVRPPARMVGPDSPYSRITTIHTNREDDGL